MPLNVIFVVARLGSNSRFTKYFLRKKSVRLYIKNLAWQRLNLFAPTLNKGTHRADMRIYPKCGIHSLAQEVLALSLAIVTLVKPELYV